MKSFVKKNRYRKSLSRRQAPRCVFWKFRCSLISDLYNQHRRSSGSSGAIFFVLIAFKLNSDPVLISFAIFFQICTARIRFQRFLKNSDHVTVSLLFQRNNC